MAYEFRAKRRVEFAETDLAGIMHFSNYFRYMESAEHEFFRSLGLTVHTATETGMRGWARVHASCDFVEPLRYQDKVEIHLLVSEKRSRSISYLAIFRKANGEQVQSTGVEIARGRMTVVCVGRGPDDTRMQATEIPAEVDARIDVAPPAALVAKED